ncbi:hypothetical protein [Ancylobacter amanitiformis]|uniref:Uncharacterized protein n=1 Tax=Ancylobacter amanitiformis TaxID=217069 RepID=A0ABU0LVX5_9HYPH|nr:hypothetical protein [Ancylobacter amanitiformis]MDQ0512760.1 hypothetical protein [Ancylobacter amanitiformis]
MRRSLRIIVAVTGLAAGAALGAAPAGAYEFTGTFQGGDCKAMAASIPAADLWYGHFTGQRDAFGGMYRYEWRTAVGCFKTRDACENWLYQWRSEYSLNYRMDFCVKGYVPRKYDILG